MQRSKLLEKDLSKFKQGIEGIVQQRDYLMKGPSLLKIGSRSSSGKKKRKAKKPLKPSLYALKMKQPMNKMMVDFEDEMPVKPHHYSHKN